MSTPRIVSLNPYGSRQAWLDDDGTTVYLHQGPPGESLTSEQSLWVRNDGPAPETIDLAGLPPRALSPQPRRLTRHPQGKPLLPGQVLELLWFEEGDGVALVVDGEIEAILPSWSSGEMRGYAIEARARGPLAWPLILPNDLSVRVARARAHWDALNHGTLFPRIEAAAFAHLEPCLGARQGHWAIFGQPGPPRSIASFKATSVINTWIYTTIGMASQPMPRVEAEVTDFAARRRVELVLATRGEGVWVPGLLGRLAYYPWRACTWIAGGDTIATAGVAPLGEPAKFPSVLLLEHPGRERSEAAPDLGGAADRSGDPVTYLWAMPITAAEQTWLETGECDELVRRLEASGVGWAHDPSRASVF